MSEHIFRVNTRTAPALPSRSAPRGPGPRWIFGAAGKQDVFVSVHALDTFFADAELRAPAECLGLLGGRAFKSVEDEHVYVWVTEYIGVEASGAHAHVSADPQVMWQAHRLLHERHPTLDVVGWAHSHPGHGIFFSGVDRDTQRAFCTEHMLGLVVDPTLSMPGALGVFQGEDAKALQLLDWPTLSQNAPSTPAQTARLGTRPRSTPRFLSSLYRGLGRLCEHMHRPRWRRARRSMDPRPRDPSHDTDPDDVLIPITIEVPEEPTP